MNGYTQGQNITDANQNPQRRDPRDVKNDDLVWTDSFCEPIDQVFIERVSSEVTQSCALPMAVPLRRITEYVIQAAQWFWEHVDDAVEQRNYVVLNRDICQKNPLNKTITLPSQIKMVTNVHKIQENLKYGTMGDFSMERMLMSSYSMFGGVGSMGGGSGTMGRPGYSLVDVAMSLYEVSTFNEFLNPPLSFNYNEYSNKLVLLGDLGWSDILIETFVRCKIQDLYNSYYFFRLCVCFCMRALSTIYGTFEFKYPGGITINYQAFKDSADAEIEQIKEWADSQRSTSFFYISGNF